ncbi:lytic murein transglycosylase [Mesorhizobium sp. M4B.F.Ca.ET.215.01.1.1]|nr:lytic murein transglycosylase [Mesorhizobium sp. M4B.F.Ca.ET.013.02.1.1]RVD45582.1 lytic murein transglycosylase [Mesorhizobium sp. M4B.F.Ca.ET.019.03.1.1]TGQ15644.1 lytic murein transglycosylase [Mesorhizobium sp. M4B.F.Ca.ET.215.01.1.1]TGQ48777.1 lytic murein transglycosylase [Mesorhizobium sp. M00.F.Ca.ET.220.01.1.1]TGR11711.1 lytic murein transglycosylase [Mesorhizobium sp. M4B.F.Ca.ET.203.01.1.1]TGT45088.1 lytic murein transglycosylase [Mesorhizobium sp. M4B.F.Ca.ET.169.01.1.1]TIW9522
MAVEGQSRKAAFLRAPLCPAGHLPHKGGDQLASRLSPIVLVAGLSGAPKLPISPQVGEMSGRTERRAAER